MLIEANDILKDIMVEVFRTNVTEKEQAELLIDKIQRAFADHKANFDLGDCDRILRVISSGGIVRSDFVIRILSDHGFLAEVLPDIPYTLNDDRRKELINSTLQKLSILN